MPSVYDDHMTQDGAMHGMQFTKMANLFQATIALDLLL